MTLPTLPRLVNAVTDRFPAVMFPVVPKLPTLALPVAFSVPATFAPVLVTTNTFATPFELMFTFALAATVTFELPLMSAVPALIGCQERPPDPFVCK